MDIYHIFISIITHLKFFYNYFFIYRFLELIFLGAGPMTWHCCLMTCNFNDIFRMSYFLRLVFSAVFDYQFRLMCFSFGSILINEHIWKLIRELFIRLNTPCSRHIFPTHYEECSNPIGHFAHDRHTDWMKGCAGAERKSPTPPPPCKWVTFTIKWPLRA